MHVKHLKQRLQSYFWPLRVVTVVNYFLAALQLQHESDIKPNWDLNHKTWRTNVLGEFIRYSTGKITVFYVIYIILTHLQLNKHFEKMF